MADKKKMSVAEILAAARKKDGKGGAAAEAAGEAAAPEAAAPVESAPAEAAAEAAPEPASSEPAAKPAKPKPAAAAGGRPNVSDILAAARANKGAAAPAAAAATKPISPKPAAAKAAAPKPAAKPAAEKATEKPAKAPAAASGIKDTASILAAARGGVKPGPMSKAEAAARLKPAPAAPAKTKPSVPPMPVKPESVRAKPAKAAKEGAAEPEERRWFLTIGFTSLAATLGMWSLGCARFMFPNVLIEPPSKFKVGFPSDFAPGLVETKFKAQFGVWVVNGDYQGQPEIYALKSVCTHLGCTPNWLEAEQKFKCPCHGSGFYKDGINFEGPAPRPLERYAIRLADDGQLEIDKSKTFQEEMGQWKDPASFVLV